VNAQIVNRFCEVGLELSTNRKVLKLEKIIQMCVSSRRYSSGILRTAWSYVVAHVHPDLSDILGVAARIKYRTIKIRQTLYPRNVRYLMKTLYPHTCIPYGTRTHFRRLRRTARKPINLPNAF